MTLGGPGAAAAHVRLRAAAAAARTLTLPCCQYPAAAPPPAAGGRVTVPGRLPAPSVTVSAGLRLGAALGSESVTLLSCLGPGTVRARSEATVSSASGL